MCSTSHPDLFDAKRQFEILSLPLSISFSEDAEYLRCWIILFPRGKPPYSIRLPVIPWLEARNGLRGDEISAAESKRTRTQEKRQGE